MRDDYRAPKWSVVQLIDKLYSELWKLHDSGALSSHDDKVALRVVNAIDDALDNEERHIDKEMDGKSW